LMQRLGLSPFRKKCTKRVDSEKKKLRGEWNAHPYKHR
jgi:hypothetical protein